MTAKIFNLSNHIKQRSVRCACGSPVRCDCGCGLCDPCAAKRDAKLFAIPAVGPACDNNRFAIETDDEKTYYIYDTKHPEGWIAICSNKAVALYVTAAMEKNK